MVPVERDQIRNLLLFSQASGNGVVTALGIPEGSVLESSDLSALFWRLSLATCGFLDGLYVSTREETDHKPFLHISHIAKITSRLLHLVRYPMMYGFQELALLLNKYRREISWIDGTFTDFIDCIIDFIIDYRQQYTVAAINE